MDTQEIALNGATIRYRVQGRGPDVLLLHGWVSSGRMWRDLMQALADRFCLWAPDLAGFGDSIPARQRRVLTLDDHRRLMDAFCRAQGLRPYAVIGHSMGGTLALSLALDHPDLMERLVLLAPVVSGRLGLNLHTLLLTDFGQWVLSLSHRLWPLTRASTMTFFVTPGYFMSEAARRVAEDAQKATRGAAYGGLQSVLHTDHSPRLAEIPHPTLVVVGARDITVPPAEGQLAARRIPDARLVRLPGIAHQITDEAPAEIARLLREFLAEAPAPARVR